MSPRINTSRDSVPQHDHSDPVNGGKLTTSALANNSGVARLDVTAVQTFLSSLVIPGGNITGSLELKNLNTTPLQSTVGSYIMTLGAEAITDGRALTLPDTDGKLTASNTLVALTGRTTSVSGDAMASPDVGHYAFLVYAEITTAGTAGTLAVTITHTGSTTLTQTVIASLALTSTMAASGIAVCKVASGGVTYSATLTGVVGSPVYSLSIIPLGRFA